MVGPTPTPQVIVCDPPGQRRGELEARCEGCTRTCSISKTAVQIARAAPVNRRPTIVCFTCYRTERRPGGKLANFTMLITTLRIPARQKEARQ